MRTEKLSLLMVRIGVLSAALISVAWAQSVDHIGAAGYVFPGPIPVAQGQIITLFVRGLNAPNADAASVPLPTTLSGISIVVKNPPTPNYPTMLPIFSVHSYLDACSSGLDAFCDVTAITVQVPVEPTCLPAGGPNDCRRGNRAPVKITVQANGAAAQDFSFSVLPQVPHILNSCDSIFGRGGICYPLATHSDGTLISQTAPARLGEMIVLYGVGLGATQNNTKTGQAATSADPIVGDFYLTSSFRIDTPPGSPAPPVTFVDSGQWIKADYVGLVKGYVGLYQINVRLPDGFPNGVKGATTVRLLLGPGAGTADLRNTEYVDITVQK